MLYVTPRVCEPGMHVGSFPSVPRPQLSTGDFHIGMFLTYGSICCCHGFHSDHQPQQNGSSSSASLSYIIEPRLSCLTLERSLVFLACNLACAKTGKRIAARIAMIAMTTSSSMSVKPLR